MKNKLWLVFILITIATWGVWGAFSDTQMENDKIPETVVYILWALTMIPCAIVALIINKGKFMHDKKSVLLGCTVGLLGAGGQLVLFKALTLGPAYIIFPFIAMSPVIVISLASIFLKEKANKWQIAGIVMALAAILLLSIQSESSREFVVTFDKNIVNEKVQIANDQTQQELSPIQYDQKQIEAFENALKDSIDSVFIANAPKDAEYKLKVSVSKEEVQKKEVYNATIVTNYSFANSENDENALEKLIFEGSKSYLEQTITKEEFLKSWINEVVKSGFLWIILAVLVLFAWGIQGFFMKFANNTMDAESIFVWMAISGLILIPVAWFMSGDAATFFAGSGVFTKSATCFGIQILNAIGALTLVYAYRYGKAVIVSPMEGLSPMVTVLLSMIILTAVPTPLQIAGICCAAFAMYALSK